MNEILLVLCIFGILYSALQGSENKIKLTDKDLIVQLNIFQVSSKIIWICRISGNID